MKKGKKLMSLLLVVVMCFTIIPIMDLGIEASAAYENTHTNTGNQRVDIVEVAKTQLGYTEGSGNNNKYGAAFGNNYAPWCAYFVSWCAKEAGISDSIIHRQGIASPFSGYFNIPNSHGNKSYFPKPGDIVFYGPNSNGDHYHVGIVETVNSSTGYITTIEGNTNNNGSSEGNIVYRHTRHYQASTICCYGYPNYINNEQHKLSVYFNANGASISSDDYKLNSNIVCQKSDGSKYVQTWTYNNPKTNGLVNYTTLGLSKPGYTFKGWGTTSSGGTIFDQSDTSLVPTDINPNIKNGSCSITLYAIWEVNALEVYYNANGAIIDSEKYELKGDYIYNKSDGSISVHTWSYNETKVNGLTNYTYFGLSKPGYTFKGWGTSADGGTIFDQNDTSLVATDIEPNIKNESCSITLYAIWEANALEVYYNANGAIIDSEKYELKGDYIYNKSDGSISVHTWSYNETKVNGLTNYTYFGLSKPGYTFKGWGTSADGGTIFDQNDTSLVATDIEPNIKNESCSITLYAIWEKIVLTSDSDAVIDDENGLIFGLDEGLSNIEEYVSLSGDGAEIEFTPNENGNGTGSVVRIMAGGTELASYTIVIFGDVNGDGMADAEDTTYFTSYSNFENLDYYERAELFKAADLNGDGAVDAMDEEEMNAVANFEAYIDQKADGTYRVIRY